MWKSSSRRPATLSKINSFTCVFRWFEHRCWTATLQISSPWLLIFCEVILIFSFLIFTLGRVCFSPFLICRSPTVRSCCSRFDNSEVIFRGCDYIITANLSFHSKFQDEIIQRKKESEAATGVVLGKRDVPKNSCSESYQAKFAVKIREKYLQSS